MENNSLDECTDTDFFSLRSTYNISLPAQHHIDTIILKHQIFDYFDPDVIRTHFFNEGSLTPEQTKALIFDSMKILDKEDNLLIIDRPVTIFGDIHGQFYDLCNMLSKFDLKKDTLVFLGDYVDRGLFSVEVYLYLLSLKIAHPMNIFLLRGNHESEKMTTYFTFKTECIYKYDESMYNFFVQSFYSLPLAAVISNSIYCAHGGISPNIDFIKEINTIDRFREPPFSGIYCDILWSDPHPKFNMKLDYSLNTQRNCSFYFSERAVQKFLIKNNLRCIIRGHEVQNEGYRLYVNSEDGIATVITIFSAPNYCDVYNNKGALMYYDGKTTTIMKYSAVPHPFYLNNYLDSINWSFPFVCEKASGFFLDILKFLENKPDSDEELLHETKIFTGSMALMRNERECLTELNDEESTELPSCSLKNIDSDLTFEEAREKDKVNETSITGDVGCEGKSVKTAPSCTNEIIQMLEKVELLEGIQDTTINVNEERKVECLKIKKQKEKKKTKRILKDKNN